MDLNLSQLQAITLGALNIRQEADGFHFDRMTPTQVINFTQAEEEFGPKCEVSSGVRLDFYTDSPILALRWHNAELVCGRTFCYFDVLVDGQLLVHSGTMDCTAEPAGDFCVALPEGMHRVQVFFPGLNKMVVAAVTLADGATVMPHRCAKRILFHGDSITQGYDAIFPSGSYANLLARHYDAEILNQAIGGAMFDPAVVQPVGAFDFVVVGYGTNDWSKKNFADFTADAAAFMARLSVIYGNLPVFVILPIWRGDTDRTDTAGDFMECRALLGRFAASQGFHVVDDYDLVPHDPRLFGDGYLHPTNAGFQLYAQRLIEVIDEKLAQ